MTVAATRVATAVVLGVSGEVDTFTAPNLRAAVAEVLEAPDVAAVIIDLSQVGFFGSAGLGVLVDIDADVTARAAVLRVVVDHHRGVVEPLQVTGLDRHLVVFHCLSDALGAAADSGGDALR